MAVLSDHAWSARGRAAAVGGVLAIGLFVAPLLFVVVRDVSLIVPQHEFIGYRYFTSLSVLGGEPENVFVVQGVPMGIVQHGLVWALMRVLDQPSAAIPTLEAFARATLAVAYGLGAAALAAAFFLLRAPLAVRGAIALVALSPWYAWSYPSVPFLLAPEYWIFELSYAVAAVVWAGSLHGGSSSRVRWGVREVLGIGLWLAAGATLKVSLVGIGALPVLLRLRVSSASLAQAGKRLLVVAVAGGLWSLALVWVYFLGDSYYAGRAVQDFAAFIAPWRSGPHHAVEALDFASLWETLTAPSTSHARGSLASFVLALAIGLVALGRGVGRPGHGLLCAAAVVFLLGHVVVVSARPSSTSLFDLSLYALAVVPVLAAGTTGRRQPVLVAAAMVPMIWLAWTSEGWKLARSIPSAEYESARRTIGDVQRYVESVGRPRVLFLPDNRWTGQSIDQIVLFHGRLGLGDASDRSIRSRVLPGAELLGASEWELQELARRIEAGYLVVWAEAEGMPAARDTFPPLRLLDEGTAIVRSWEHAALDRGRRIHAAHLDRPATRIMSVTTDPPVEREARLQGDGRRVVLNHNPRFREGSDDDPIPGFSVAAASAGSYRVRRRTDETGPVIRIEARRPGAFLLLSSTQSTGGPPEAALCIRASARAVSRGKFRLMLHRAVSGGGPAQAYVVDAKPRREWTTLTRYADRATGGDHAAQVSAGLFEVSGGEWFEIRELSLMAGSAGPGGGAAGCVEARGDRATAGRGPHDAISVRAP